MTRGAGDEGGVLLIDKPTGMTSHDVVARIRRIARTREVGHAGTLDPMATGLLVVAVGEATKLVPWLTAAEKTYEAEVALGVATDSLDADGAVTERAAVPADVLEALSAGAVERFESVLQRERERREQVPPVVSAIKVDGVRAYARARAGETPVLAARPVEVRNLTLLALGADPPWLRFRLAVSKGYYVRAFARDVAQSLETLGHLTALRRLRSGAFSLQGATALDALSSEWPAPLVSLAEAAARCLPAAVLDETGVRAARHGQRVAPEHLRPTESTDAPGEHTVTAGPTAWLDAHGRLVAVGEQDPAGEGRVLRGFVPRSMD
jgi:tRNA pseudouridine55 synthase